MRTGRLGGRVSRVFEESSGAVVTEFALTLPLLLLMVFGLVDFGIAFREYQVLTNAAREGARIAVLPGYSDDDVRSRVDDYLAKAHLPSPVTTIATGLMAPAGGAIRFTTRIVTVQMEHPFSFLAPITPVFGRTFGTLTLKASSEMRIVAAAGG